MSFLHRLLAPFAAGLIVGAAIWFVQLPDTAEEACMRDLGRLLKKMEDSPIAGAKPGDEIETDWDRFLAMSQGKLRIDVSLLSQYRLEETTERLLQATKAKEFARSAKLDSTRDQNIVRVYLFRGHQLCQQGRLTEGRDWFFRALAYSRLRADQDGMFGCLREYDIIRSVGRYATTWSESERAEFMKGLRGLPAPPDLHTLTSHAFLKAGLRELAPLPAERRKAKAVEFCIRTGHDPDWVAEMLVLSSHNITSDQLEQETAALIGRLQPLSFASIQAATKRSDEVSEIIEAEAVKFAQSVHQAQPRNAQEFRRVLQEKADFFSLGKVLAAATDEEVLDLVEQSKTPLNKNNLALISKHPASPDASKHAELFFLGVIQRGTGPFQYLLTMKTQARCFELAMATGGKPAAAEVAALEGPYGGPLTLDKDSSGRRAVLFRDEHFHYNPDNPLLVLDPIK